MTDYTLTRRQRFMLVWITFSLPLFFAGHTVTLLLSKVFLDVEYRHISMPKNVAWTEVERLTLARETYDYLQDAASAERSIHLLTAIRNPETNEQLFSEREIAHMKDVKNVTNTARYISSLIGIVTLSFVIILYRRHAHRPHALRAIRNGCVLTIIIALAGGLFLTQLPWQTFFNGFHNLFFTPGTWIFSSSSGLIRLFPRAFWQDMAFYSAVLYVAQPIVVLLFLPLLYPRKHE